MQRPHFTIETDDGSSYDANHLAVVRGPGGPKVSFECSGVQHLKAPEAIKKVSYSSDGATWCPFCDESLEGKLNGD